MVTKRILFIFLFLFSLTFVTAEGFKAGEETNLQFTCTVNYQIPSPSTTYNISVYYPNGTALLENAAAQSKGQGAFNYSLILPTSGNYKINSFCYDGSNGNFSSTDYLEVTASGRQVSDSKMFANIILFIFFVLLILTFHFTTRDINYEKWYNSIIAKYEHRNFVKVIISSIGYNTMKNKFIWYYLFGLPLILIVTDIAYTFGVDSMINLLQITLSVYYYGFLLVAIFFFGYLQEWVVEIIDEIKNLDFGVSDR